MAIVTAVVVGITTYRFNKFAKKGDSMEMSGFIVLGFLELITWGLIFA